MKKVFLQFFADAAAVTAESQGTPQEAEMQDAAVMQQADAQVAQTEEPVADNIPKAQADLPDIKQLQRIAEGRQRMQGWISQAEQLKEFYPSVSFYELYNGNENFGQLLRAGVSVRQAYEVTHLPQILTCAMQYAARKAAEKTANAMRSSCCRPQENGLSERKAALPTEKNVNSLTQTDIIRILDRVGKGDKITF